MYVIFKKDIFIFFLFYLRTFFLGFVIEIELNLISTFEDVRDSVSRLGRLLAN